MTEDTEKRRGHYIGTEIDRKWWKRYRGEGLFMRGMGQWWINGHTLYFHRTLTNAPFTIDLSQLTGIETGSWHAGKLVGGDRVIKLVWEKDGRTLSAGFVLCKKEGRDTLIEHLLSYSSGSAVI